MTNGAQESEVIQSFRLALEQLPGRATNNRLHVLFQDRKGPKVRF